ncbi:MAG: 30S ribosomal protein S16 [Bacteroidetes bacterium]|nr:30S ribosomal protein S16 [Bacteroidota bacterium]
MPAKIRLSRHGKKHKAFYHIVVADGRAPRDGRFIEKIGTYDPIVNPAEIKLDFDKALEWLQKGALPTDTARTILSFKGVLYKYHLLKGVKKGALTEVEAEAKFQNWLTDKETKIASSRSSAEEKLRSGQKALLDAEVKVNEDRAAVLAKRKAAEIDAKVKVAQAAATEKASKEEVEAAAAVKEVIETPEAEANIAEETKAVEVAEAPAEEAKVEEVFEAPVEEAKVEDVVEASAEEAKTDEVDNTPKEETKE